MLRQSQEGGTSQVFVLNRSLGNLTEAVKGLPTPRGGCQRGAPSMDLFDNKEGYIYVLTARPPRSYRRRWLQNFGPALAGPN